MKGLILNNMDGKKEEAYALVRLGLRNNLRSHVCALLCPQSYALLRGRRLHRASLPEATGAEPARGALRARGTARPRWLRALGAGACAVVYVSGSGSGA